MMTVKATAQLKIIAQTWLSENNRVGDPDYLARKFQRYLQDASYDLSIWPTVIMDWTLGPDQDAVQARNPATRTGPMNAPHYPYHDDHFCLNGVVSAPNRLDVF